MKLASLLLCSMLMVSGCVSVGRGSHKAYDWTGEVYPENPVSIAPYFLGLTTGALGSSPLLLVSWPMTAIGYPESGDEEDKLWSTLSPVAVTGALVGTLLGSIFYPFGLPFMDAEAQEDEWEESEEWGEEDNFDDGPPGGDEDPVPVPWLSEQSEIPTEDGVPRAPYRRSTLTPWEDYSPSR